MAILGQWDSGTLPTIVGDGVSYVSNGGWDGRPAIQFNQPAGVVSQVRFQFGAVANLAMRTYIQMPTAWSSSGQPIIMARPSLANTTGRTTLAGTAAPGQVRLTDRTGGVTAASSSNGLVGAEQWYRLELQFNGASGQGRTAVFPLGSDIPLWNSGWVTNDFTMPAIYAEFGPGWSGTTLAQIRMTNLLVTDDISNWIGRAEGDNIDIPNPQTSWRILTAGGWVEAFVHDMLGSPLPSQMTGWGSSSMKGQGGVWNSGILGHLQTRFGWTFTNNAQGGDTSADTLNKMTAAAPTGMSDITLIWTGKNDVPAATTTAETLSNIAACVALVQTPYYLVLGHFVNTNQGSGQRTKVFEQNSALASVYGSRFVDVASYLASSQLWTDTGVTPTADDLVKQSETRLPVSVASDAGHMNHAGYQGVGKLVGDHMVGLGWVS